MCVHLCEHIMKLRRTDSIYLGKAEGETSENNFIAEYMLSKSSIHVFKNSTGKIYDMFSKSVLFMQSRSFC